MAHKMPGIKSTHLSKKPPKAMKATAATEGDGGLKGGKGKTKMCY